MEELHESHPAMAAAQPVENPALAESAGMSWRVIAFLVVQVLVIGSGAGWATYRVRQMDALKILPTPRNEPLTVTPQFDIPDIVSDDQLHEVLTKLQPRLRGLNPKINNVDHALRMWGVQAKFADEECLSGMELRELLLDHRRFSAAWGDKTSPYLKVGPNGIRIRTQEGNATASHVDHTLASLAETGTPLDFPIITPQGEARVRDLLRQSLRDFSLNQVEYEWSTLAYALYLPTTLGWYTTEGQLISFDRLADRIMRQEFPQGVCLGNHRLHALVMLLRVDEQSPLLSPAKRAKIIAFLKDVTARYVASQHAEGYWDRGWATAAAGAETPADPLATRILATGHVLEWWSLAPAEIHPPKETLVRAGQWLCGTISKMTPREIEVNYTFLSHAGRALALWRGRFPADVLATPSAE